MAVWATLTLATWRWVGYLRALSLSDLLRVERASNPAGRRLVGDDVCGPGPFPILGPPSILGPTSEKFAIRYAQTDLTGYGIRYPRI